MKRALPLVAILVILAAVVSCTGSGGGSPSSVVKGYYTAVNAGDFARAEGYLVPGQKFPETFCELKGKIEKIKILDEQTGEALGVSAADVIVEVTLTGVPPGSILSLAGGTRHVLLEKRKSGWRISFIQ